MSDVRKREVDMKTRDWVLEVPGGKRGAAWDSCVAEKAAFDAGG